jgi:CPA1 family monovalent cation:H+ antiporter
MPLGEVVIDGIAEVVLAVSVLLAVASLLAVLTRGTRVPLTLLLVIVGFAGGELARGAGVELPLEGETFHDVLLFAFLPALVFEAALSLPARVFMKNLMPILALAVVARAIATVLVGLMVHFGLGISLTAALLFGALISATDPVAVTATFRELGVPNRLLVLVEGESLLNDGIAIVLFNILSRRSGPSRSASPRACSSSSGCSWVGLLSARSSVSASPRSLVASAGCRRRR